MTKNYTNIAIAIMLVFVLGFLLGKYSDREILKSQPKEIWVTDKAAAFWDRQDIRDFNQDLKGRPEAQKESIAAMWITSNRVALLPVQKVVVLNWYGKIINIRTKDGSEYWIQSSMIEDENDTRDITERMVRKRP